MTVRELESVLPRTCNLRCYSNVTDDLIFISHGSVHPCEGDRSHLDDKVARIKKSNTVLMYGDMSIWVNERR